MSPSREPHLILPAAVSLTASTTGQAVQALPHLILLLPILRTSFHKPLHKMVSSHFHQWKQFLIRSRPYRPHPQHWQGQRLVVQECRMGRPTRKSDFCNPTPTPHLICHIYGKCMFYSQLHPVSTRCIPSIHLTHTQMSINNTPCNCLSFCHHRFLRFYLKHQKTQGSTYLQWHHHSHP